MDQVCRECKSARLLRNTQVLAFGGFFGRYPVLIQGPMVGYKGPIRTTVSASVCVDCETCSCEPTDWTSCSKPTLRFREIRHSDSIFEEFASHFTQEIREPRGQRFIEQESHERSAGPW